VCAAESQLALGKTWGFPGYLGGLWEPPLGGGLHAGSSSYQELQNFFIKTIAIDSAVCIFSRCEGVVGKTLPAKVYRLLKWDASATWMQLGHRRHFEG
jgi:hypothetical protein